MVRTVRRRREEVPVRRIAEHSSIRVGHVVYLTGDEAELYKVIDPASARRMCGGSHPQLLGDWSGCGPSAAPLIPESESRRGPVQQPVAQRKPKETPPPVLEEDDIDDDEDETTTEVVYPVHYKLDKGGWYLFFDADSEPVMIDGKHAKAQGIKKADELLKKLNG